MLRRDQWLDLARKLDWDFSYVKEEDVYPRYPVVFDKFWKAWLKFSEFCKDENLGEPIINQLEITYINHADPTASDLFQNLR